MKTKLLTLLILLFSTLTIFAQITAGQVDDFESGTVLNWFEGGGSPNPPINISTDGPAGVNDNYLQDNSSGGGGAGSRMVIRNTTQWVGNYTSEGIVAIKFDARVLTNDLDLRVALDGSGGRICTTIPITVTAGSGWTSVVIPISVSDFSLVGGSNIASTLSNTSEMRILSNSSPSWRGESILATLEVDNIEASTVLGLTDFSVNAFSIYPNPSISKLNILLSQGFNNSTIEVYDVLGKRVYFQNISELNSSINVSQWDNGVYLVKVTNEESTQTKRFIKQ